MQSSLINPQPFATPVAQPLNHYQPFMAMSPGMPNPVNPGMTQLPSMPRPPYLQTHVQSAQALPPLPTPSQFLSANPALANATFINGRAAGALNSLPTPQQLAPSVYNQAAPVYQTAASVPVAMPPNLPEVPSPYMVAPWLYLAKPATPQVPTAPSYPPLLTQPLMQQQQQPMQAPPQPQMQQAPPPPMPPQQPPQVPPQQKAPTAPLGDGGLTDSQIQSLNERLNSDSEDTRADAAIELFKILDKDPSLSSRAPYSQYVNAFMEKIMKDPSAVVRTAGELTLQTGRVKQPSEGLVNQIGVLSKNSGGLSGEGGVISSLMGSIKNKTLGQGFSDLPGAMTTIPGSEEAAQLLKKALPPSPEASVPPLPPNGQPNVAQPIQNDLQPQPTAAIGAMPAYASPANFAAPLARGQAMPAGQYSLPPAGSAITGGQAAYGPPQAIGPMPVMPMAGNRINYLSQAQQPTAIMGQPGLMPSSGQRLNIQEGYRQ